MIGNVLTELGVLSAAVWLATEGIGRFTGKRKPLVALILGPLSGFVAYGSGLMDFGVTDGVWGWVASAFFGLISTLGAAVAHDKVVLAAAPKK